MKAIAFTRAREAPELIELPTPTPGPGEVLVRVEAAGLGGADWGFFQLDSLPRLPLVPGFEAVGVVEATRGGVGVEVGARVGVTPLASVCGGCDLCERGLERWCAKATLHGWHRDGLLATHVVTPERALVPLRATDEATTWAPVFATGWTAMSAVRLCGGRGVRVGVLGLGALGLISSRLAQREGLTVEAWDVDQHRRRAAGDVARGSAFVNDSLDAVIVCTPSAQAIQLANRAVKRGGVVVLAGASPGSRFDLSVFDTVMRGVTLRPAFLGSRSELDELMDHVRSGGLEVPVTTAPLSEIPQRFWAIRDLGFLGRLVAVP